MDRWEREAAAAAMLRECRAALAAGGTTVIRQAVGAAQSDAGIVDWRHYPKGEVYDPASHVQYFYHRHPGPAATAAAGPAEAGHFHVFLRGEGMPAGVRPLLLPEIAVANAPPPRQSAPRKRGRSDAVCHLVGIAVDARGDPVRLFTANRWVTGETWFRADDVILMLDRVRLSAVAPAPLASRWVEAVVRLFQAEIAALLRDRDAAVMRWRWRWPRGNVFEDARLETPSSLAIDLGARLEAVEMRRSGAAAAPAGRPLRNLPPMAEGWGA